MALTDTGEGRVILDAWGSCRITLAGTVKRGDCLGYSSGWKRALATTGTAIQTRLIAGEDGISGDVITAYVGAVIGGLTGMTAGNPVYQAEGTDNGEYTETAPSTSGDVATILGRSLTATEMVVMPLQALGVVV